MQCSARIVADSIGGNDIRLTSFEIAYPAYLHGNLLAQRHVSCWSIPNDNEIRQPDRLMHAIVTATEWDSVFEHWMGAKSYYVSDEMESLARLMCEARIRQVPKTVSPGDWHLPYIDQMAIEDLTLYVLKTGPRCGLPMDRLIDEVERLAPRISAARCARVSGWETPIERDLDYFNVLTELDAEHPVLEHQAYADMQLTAYGLTFWQHADLHGNCKGWVQHSKIHLLETRKDPRYAQLHHHIF